MTSGPSAWSPCSWPAPAKLTAILVARTLATNDCDSFVILLRNWTNGDTLWQIDERHWRLSSMRFLSFGVVGHFTRIPETLSQGSVILLRPPYILDTPISFR